MAMQMLLSLSLLHKSSLSLPLPLQLKAVGSVHFRESSFPAPDKPKKEEIKG
jgi:hypothetical protein